MGAFTGENVRPMILKEKRKRNKEEIGNLGTWQSAESIEVLMWQIGNVKDLLT